MARQGTDRLARARWRQVLPAWAGPDFAADRVRLCRPLAATPFSRLVFRRALVLPANAHAFVRNINKVITNRTSLLRRYNRTCSSLNYVRRRRICAAMSCRCPRCPGRRVLPRLIARRGGSPRRALAPVRDFRIPALTCHRTAAHRPAASNSSHLISDWHGRARTFPRRYLSPLEYALTQDTPGGTPCRFLAEYFRVCTELLWNHNVFQPAQLTRLERYRSQKIEGPSREVMDIRSFRAITKSLGAVSCQAHFRSISPLGGYIMLGQSCVHRAVSLREYRRNWLEV